MSTSDHLVLVREHLLSIIVCVPKEWDKARVESETNHWYYCGTTNGWHIPHRPVKKGNPCVCADNPERRHWLLDA